MHHDRRPLRRRVGSLTAAPNLATTTDDRVAVKLGKGFVQSVSFKAHKDDCGLGAEVGALRESSVMGSRGSEHGTLYGAMASNNITTDQAVIDGEVKPGYMVPWVSTNQTNPPVLFPPFFYSPDGSHVAYVGQKQDGTGKQAVVLDGVAYEGASLSFGFPDFSPDSRHFAWINTTSKGWIVFIDEKMGPAYDNLVQSRAGARFIDGHTYRYYGVKDNLVYRVTIDVGA